MRITKRYHRGNDDSSEHHYLTAIFRIRLDVDLSDCKKSERGNCVGDAEVFMSIDIRSPDGKGNGNAAAGMNAAAFGLYFPKITGQFTPFNPKRKKGSDQWRVGTKISLGKLPCNGGELSSKKHGKVVIASELLRKRMPKFYGEAYSIEYSVVIAASELDCGNEENVRADFELKQGEKAFVLDVDKKPKRGGKLLHEVKKGDEPPLPPKDVAKKEKIKSAKDWADSKARKKLKISKSGQVVKK